MITSQTGRNFFTACNVASTGYIYTSAGASGANDGWITSKSDYTILAYCCATLSASSLTFRVEGRWADYNRPVEIYVASVNTINDIDQVLTLTEKLKEIRVGVKVNNTATPNIFYVGMLNSEVK